MQLGTLVMISLVIRAAPLGLVRRAMVSRTVNMNTKRELCKPKVIFVLGGMYIYSAP